MSWQTVAEVGVYVLLAAWIAVFVGAGIFIASVIKKVKP